MAESLLASLYSRIKGSQEDVATASLQYILSSSEHLNKAYNKLLSNALKLDIGSDVHYTCQSVGEDKERPDMSGVDLDGNEIILCEMKFYAGLTDNQPKACFKGWYFLNSSKKTSAWVPKIADLSGGVPKPGDKWYGWCNTLSAEWKKDNAYYNV